LSADHKPDTAYVKELLSLPTPEQRAAFLEAEGLLNAEGLDRLLDVADGLVNDDPGKARRLAELCAGLSDDTDAPAAMPRANYIRAMAHGLNGEFDEELRLNKAAYDGYLALGMNLEALRTNVGKMAALLELGRYQEVLVVGQVVLDALDGKGEIDVRPTPQEADLLTAMVHQNFGGCYENMGRYDEALEAYAVAEEKYGALGMTERLGEILSNRGAILLYLGRGSEALVSHEAAVAVFHAAGLVLPRAMALANIGETHLRLANYTRSLNAFEEARHLLRSLDAHTEDSFVLRNTADAYLELNLYSEALEAYGKTNEWLRDAGIEHERARTLWGIGSALTALSNFEGAERALVEAADKFAAAGNLPMLSGVMLEQASLLAARGGRKAALDTARRQQ
jgi:tetratricopeptide (TPR) repeat protein